MPLILLIPHFKHQIDENFSYWTWIIRLQVPIQFMEISASLLSVPFLVAPMGCRIWLTITFYYKVHYYFGDYAKEQNCCSCDRKTCGEWQLDTDFGLVASLSISVQCLELVILVYEIVRSITAPTIIYCIRQGSPSFNSGGDIIKYIKKLIHSEPILNCRSQTANTNIKTAWHFDCKKLSKIYCDWLYILISFIKQRYILSEISLGNHLTLRVTVSCQFIVAQSPIHIILDDIHLSKKMHHVT